MKNRATEYFEKNLLGTPQSKEELINHFVIFAKKERSDLNNKFKMCWVLEDVKNLIKDEERRNN